MEITRVLPSILGKNIQTIILCGMTCESFNFFFLPYDFFLQGFIQSIIIRSLKDRNNWLENVCK